MSLNWDISKIANKDTVCFRQNADEGRVLRGLTERLIWGTLAVDLGRITKQNIVEWEERLQMLGRVYQDDAWTSITRAQLREHIGLETNVITQTRAAFMKKMSKALQREAREAAVRACIATAQD